MSMVANFPVYRIDGVQTIAVADIIADSKPATMPTNGKDIEGLPDDAILQPGSTLLDCSNGKIYMYTPSKSWNEI